MPSPRVSVSIAGNTKVAIGNLGEITVQCILGGNGSGTGDVTGPASATDNAIVRFNGTTGKVIQNSGITIADGASGTLSGTNTGDVTLAGENYLSIANQVITAAAINLASSHVTGDLPLANLAPSVAASRLLGRGDSGAGDWQPLTLGSGLAISGTTLDVTSGSGGINELTGDVTAGPGIGSQVATLATVNSNVGSFGSASKTLTATANAKGLITAIAQTDIQIAQSQVTNLTADLGNKQPLDATLTALAGLAITQGSLIYGTGADAFAVLAKDTNATRYLANTGTNNAPAWAQVNLANGVTGYLPFANFVQAASAGFVGATGAGDYSHRTPTQVTAALDNFVGDSGSGGTKGLVLAPAAGDAAAGKFLKADGTWATPAGSGDVVASGTLTNNALIIGQGSTTVAATSTGAGILTFLGTPSSANLAAALTDETGTGLAVFNSSPTFADDITVGVASSATGIVKLVGTTSGTVSLSVADAAGTWTLKLPTSAGSNGQFLQTNGSGVTSWATASGGTNWVVKTTNYTAVSGDQILSDGSDGATISLPSTPSDHDFVWVAEDSGNTGLIISGNGNNFNIGGSSYNVPAGYMVSCVFHTAQWDLQIYPSVLSPIALADTSTATTQITSDNSTRVATTAFVHDIFDGYVPTTITVAGETTDTTCFLAFFTDATGNLAPKTNSNLAFDSSTGVLTLTAPILGTPTSGVLTNCTGLPISSGVSGLGTNVATFLETPSSANLASALTDETGTGLAVFNNSPTFVDDITIGGTGVATGSILLKGTTSGTVTLKVADAAGTWTMTLPTTDGNANQFLKTDGSGVTSWSDLTVPTTITVANEATDTTCFPLFVTAATGDLGPKTNSNLAFNSSTGVTTFGAAPVVPALSASVNDSGALGAAGTAFSDLFLASGGVINWDNGNATLTHSTGLITSNVPFSVGTSNAITCGTIELGAASDTTLSRSAAGTLASEVGFQAGVASGATGLIKLVGTTSGVVTLSVADAAGTWTMKLPTSAGTSGYFLKTDGSGNTSWDAASGGGIGGSTGSVDNAMLRADGTGGSTLQSSDITISDASTSTQNNVAIVNAHSGQTNSDLVLTPKGSGAFVLGPKPDGTGTGGNARGLYAVDLSMVHVTKTYVASGDYSVNAGNQCTASGGYSFVAGGGYNVSSGGFAFSQGYFNTASGTSSVAQGDYNIASFNYTRATGYNAKADRYGQCSHSSGAFSSNGDAQAVSFVLRNKTTTNSAVTLYLDGASTRLTVPSGKVLSCLIRITGIKSDGSAVADYVRQYALKNVGGTTSEVYAAVTIGTDNAAGTSIAISADNTNDALQINVTGITSETWRWVATVEGVEIAYGS